MEGESLGLMVFGGIFLVFFLFYWWIVKIIPYEPKKENNKPKTIIQKDKLVSNNSNSGCVLLGIVALCALIAIPLIFVNVTAEVVSWYKKEPVGFIVVVLLIGGAALYLYRINED